MTPISTAAIKDMSAPPAITASRKIMAGPMARPGKPDMAAMASSPITAAAELRIWHCLSADLVFHLWLCPAPGLLPAVLSPAAARLLFNLLRLRLLSRQAQFNSLARLPPLTLAMSAGE